MECDVKNLAVLHRPSISIHALLWSATKNWQYRNIGDKISIHALLWSATPADKNRSCCLYFYPRTPVECDRYQREGLANDNYFYPRTPVECDQKGMLNMTKYQVFLSTHSCGVRHTTMSRLRIGIINFYPRTPVECDHHPSKLELMLQ